MQSVWAFGVLSQGHMGAPLYHYSGQVNPRFGDLGSLEEWKWCHNVMVEADVHLRPLHTSMVDIYKVFESLACCLKGIWVHPYTVTPCRKPPRYVPYKCTYVPYDGTFGASDQGQTLDVWQGDDSQIHHLIRQIHRFNISSNRKKSNHEKYCLIGISATILIHTDKK